MCKCDKCDKWMGSHLKNWNLYGYMALLVKWYENISSWKYGLKGFKKLKRKLIPITNSKKSWRSYDHPLQVPLYIYTQ